MAAAQILNFLLPGDLIELQAAMFDAARHGIEALTDVQLCLLPRRKVWALFGQMPDLAFDVAWLGAREESFVDENLTSVGRRSAAERIAALIVTLYKRAKMLGLVTDGRVRISRLPKSMSPAPLGLSLVRTDRRRCARLRHAIGHASRAPTAISRPRPMHAAYRRG